MGQCPTFTDGATAIISAGGGTIQAHIWMGNQGGGPILLYWHGVGSSAEKEVPLVFDTAAIAAAGGIVFGFESTSRQGTPPTGDTFDGAWYQSDAAYADQAVACALQNYNMDAMHIHSEGFVAGGFETVYLAYARSGYIASVITYSAGILPMGLNQVPPQRPSYIPAAIAAHGAVGQDAVMVAGIALDYASASLAWEMSVKQAGGFVADCDDGAANNAFLTKLAPDLKPVTLKFIEDHPFGAKPDPYASGLPAGFPSYCKIY